MAAFAGDAAARIASGGCSYGIFVRVAGTPVLRMWSGPGDYLMPADDVEPADALYKANGALGEIPTLKQLINGDADSIKIPLSGLDATIKGLFDSDPEALVFKPSRIGVVIFDGDHQPLSETLWLHAALSDDVYAVGDGDGAQIVLSLATALSGRTRSEQAFYSDAAQQRRSPGDRICERTARYARGITIAWPV
jgi:hypothetical protein